MGERGGTTDEEAYSSSIFSVIPSTSFRLWRLYLEIWEGFIHNTHTCSLNPKYKDHRVDMHLKHFMPHIIAPTHITTTHHIPHTTLTGHNPSRMSHDPHRCHMTLTDVTWPSHVSHDPQRYHKTLTEQISHGPHMCHTTLTGVT